MPEAKAKKLNRLLRVRTLQLNQTLGEEAAANARVAQEEQLRHRIAQLAANVTPVPSPTPGTAMGIAAAAHYRDRLAQSAQAAERRVAAATRGLDQARAATRDARRDQDAIGRLLERAEREAALKALRALEEMPAERRNRHDPC